MTKHHIIQLMTNITIKTWKYKLEASRIKKFEFGGRLADYAYYDMDMTISAALKKFDQIKKNQMNILLTGGAGYIGHVCNLFLDKGYNVTVIDSLVTEIRIYSKKQKLVISDIADKTKVEKLIKEEKFDLVLHFAGLIRVDESVKEPEKYYKFNFEKAKTF